MITNNSQGKKIDQAPIEMDFLIVADKPGVKEELIKENLWNMRLEAWKDKTGKEKVQSWVVEKEEFEKKDLVHNKVLNSAIVGQRNKMVILKIHKDNADVKEVLQKLQAINITGALSVDKNFAKEYENHEAWLLEKDKVTHSLIAKINNSARQQTGQPKLVTAVVEKKWPDDYYKVEEIKGLLCKTFNTEDKKKGDAYGYNLLLQGALMLKLRESVKNIWDYLGEINLANMEEKDLDGIKRTLVMILCLFDAKCVKESSEKKSIYYCFSHIVRNCKECANKE